MEELIERLRALVEDAACASTLQEVSRLTGGMHDLLTAMGDRCVTLKIHTRPVQMGVNDQGRTRVDDLWERA